MKLICLKKENYKVDLPFSQRVKGHIIDSRYGILLSLGYEECDQTEKSPKTLYKIEIAPFPGFMDKSLEEAFEEFKLDLKRIELPKGLSFGEYIDFLNSQKLTPSSFFAFIQIIDQDLKAQGNEIKGCDIKENSLLSFEQLKKIPEQALLKKSGHSKTKVKIYRDSPEEVAKELNRFHDGKYKHHFRLDMNGSWNVEKLNLLWSSLVELGCESVIDYFEEPLGKYEEYKELAAEMPIMHEECFQEYLKSPNQSLGLVYKPSQVNWPTPTPKRLVISSCWESPYGISALKRLAALYPRECHGLGAKIELPL